MSAPAAKRLFCTIVSYSHLAQARALAESLRDAGNIEPLHILVTDLTPAEQAAEKTAHLLSISDLGGAGPEAMVYYFDAFELCNALKPFLVSHLINAMGAERVIYLDADLWVVGSFASVWSKLDDASLLLTPHHLSPPAMNLRQVNEVEVVDLGFLNGGFTAWKAGPASARILEWMQVRLPVFGFCDRSRCMFVDQKLLPLTLSYFPEAVRVLRDPGLNVAYWNAHERNVTRTDCWRADGHPVVFFHLSGYKLAHPDRACAYLPPEANDMLMHVAPWFSEVVAAYGALLARHQSVHVARPYGHARFEGVELSPPLRRLLYSEGKLDRASWSFWRLRLVEALRRTKRKIKNSMRRNLNASRPAA